MLEAQKSSLEVSSVDVSTILVGSATRLVASSATAKDPQQKCQIATVPPLQGWSGMIWPLNSFC